MIGIQMQPEVIESPFSWDVIESVVEWRDSNPSFPRRVALGLAALPLALLGVIESVVSIALCILASPLKLVGFNLADHIFNRFINSCRTSLYAITIIQYMNITEDEVFSSN